MRLILAVLGILWTIRIIGNLLSYIRLWYEKEYRVDRMLIHLRTTQGRQILFLPFRRPGIFPKTIVLAIGGIVILSSLFGLLQLPLLVKLLIIDLLTFPVTLGLVVLLKIPTLLYHEYKISRAINLLRERPPKMVIGITGSYGKTSTKEFLATILSQKFKVLKTSKSINSPIGIAEVILQNSDFDYEVLIVEMGAYKKGEIARMTQMVAPQIGIVTAINAQHQDLFGSIENTMKAKYELIQGLVGKRVGIFNADNSYTRQLSAWAKRDGIEVWYFGKGKKNDIKVDTTFYAKNIRATASELEFAAIYGGGREKVTVQVLGEHQVTNILAAISAAVACGMPFKEAATSASRIRPLPNIMRPVPGINGSTFIDDTFNNNPDAAKAAIDFLTKFKGKKILVMQPMIELGEFSQVAHEEVGEYAAKVCDAIFLTNTNFSEFIKAGVDRVDPKKPVYNLNPHETAAFIRETIKKGDVVLFKGKEATHVLKQLSTSNAFDSSNNRRTRLSF